MAENDSSHADGYLFGLEMVLDCNERLKLLVEARVERRWDVPFAIHNRVLYLQLFGRRPI